MSYKLSILVPGIRNENWLRLYDSVASAFSGSWEIIFAGPYPLPAELEAKDNVQYIQTFRCPIAAQQQCLVVSRGEFISYASDDGWYLPNSLNVAVDSLEPEPYTTIVTAKYQEGDRVNDHMETEWYYTLWSHDTMQLPGVPKDCLLLNCGVISRALLIELGGWASDIFQCCPLAYSDFAIRAHKFGCKFILQEAPMFACTHEPGMTGTHGPIHLGQTYHDQPLFTGMYSSPANYLTRQTIKLDNWRNSSERWSMRFKD